MGTITPPDRVRTAVAEVFRLHSGSIGLGCELSQLEWNTIFERVFERAPLGVSDPAWDTLLDNNAYAALRIVREYVATHR